MAGSERVKGVQVDTCSLICIDLHGKCGCCTFVPTASMTLVVSAFSTLATLTPKSWAIVGSKSLFETAEWSLSD